jgi:transcriptional regulator with XRE-family HTH domain
MARPKRSSQPADPEQDAVTGAVAANLARLRAERGWSLDVLAGRAGVSKAMLHQIESGRSVPTIAVVWRVAQGLNVPFGDLLARPATSSDALLRRSEAKWLTNAEGSFASRALFPFDGPARSAEFYELRLKPGSVEEAAAHAHATIEHLVVSAGTIEVAVGGEVHRVAAGDCLVFAADRPHTYRNSDVRHDAHAFLMMTYALPGQIHA